MEYNYAYVMMHISRRTMVLAAFLALVVGGYLLARLSTSSQGMSPDFTDARLQGALVAQDIVNLSNDVSGSLDKVHALDEQGNYAEALNITHDLVQKSQEVRKKAVELSGQLEKMTSSLSTVQSTDARAAALEAISDRLALIARLINYSDSLSDLLLALQSRFAGTASARDAQVNGLISQINAEVTAINNFNRQAAQAMDRFDTIINKN